MALPVQSIRAMPEHRDVLQAVADLLKQGKERDLRDLIANIENRPVGGFKSADAALAFMRDRLVASLRPRMIWLFGSRARGDARQDSDFDIMVVLPDGLDKAAYTHHNVASPLVACGIPYDIVPCAWSDYLVDKDNVGTFVAKIISEGKLLYQDVSLRRSKQ